MSADELRQSLAASRGASVDETGPAVMVVGSGKGGVGKSILSVLLASSLASTGRRVLLLDGDHNLGNLHVLLGVRPAARLETLLFEDGIAPADILRSIGENLWLLPGDSGAESMYALDPIGRARLHLRLSELYDRFDAVVVDAGAGLEGAVRVSAMRATRLLVVTVPEPAALTDAYALMKIVNAQVPTLPMDVIVNRSLSEEEGREAYERLATATERFLRRGIRHLATIPEDTAVRAAVRDPQRLLPTLQASEAGRALAEAVSARLELPARARSLA